jgi:hypothetical protein
MQLSEPTTLITDYLLAVVAFAYGGRLAGGPPGAASVTRRLWAAAFLCCGAAALAGGTVHGFTLALTPLGRAVLWKGFQVVSGLAGALLAAGVALGALRGSRARAALVVIGGKLVAFLAVVARDDSTLAVVVDAAGTVALVLGMAAAVARDRARWRPWLLVALLTTAIALVVQRQTFSWSGWFNQNDACHLILTAALWPFYRAGLRLADLDAGACLEPRIEG